MRLALMMVLAVGCSGSTGAEADPELFVYVVDRSGDEPEGIELRFDTETSRAHTPGTMYPVGAFECAPQVGMGSKRAAFGMLCGNDEVASNIRVTMDWRDCESATVEGSLIIVGEGVVDYWLRCERERDARRTEENIERVELVTW